MTTFLIIVSAYYLLTSKRHLLSRRVKAVIGVFFLFLLLIAYLLYDASLR
ncbi:hypothetical protein BIZ37_22580 [Photobacterium sp. BZF1]|nr:hypothetical protein [Photobacterium sp. BZF1]MBC7005360.1 hypothetical protein [Photobacterium sp. BZF1]